VDVETVPRFETTKSEVVDPSVLKLPTVDLNELIGRTFLLEREADGTVHRAEVIRREESIDGVTEQLVVRLGDGKRQDIMTYNAVVEGN
jgi:hypothetical protein